MAELTEIISNSIADISDAGSDTGADAGDAGSDVGSEAVADATDATDGTSNAEGTVSETTEGGTHNADAAAQPKKAGRIPLHRHEAILTKARQDHETALQKAIADERGKYAQYESPEFQQQQAALRIADENPEQFLRALAQADPRYAQMIGKVFEAPQTQTTTPQIEPDVLLNDGSLGYSPATMQKLLDQRAAAVEAAIERKFNERFGGMEQDYRTHKLMQGATQKAQSQISEAESWPLFNESKAEILSALEGDRNLSLDAAYRKVVFPKLTASRDGVRKQVLAEINAKPRAASSVNPASVGTVSAPSGPRELTDVIKDSIAGLK